MIVANPWLNAPLQSVGISIVQNILTTHLQVDYDNIKNAIIEQCQIMNLQPLESFITKIIQVGLADIKAGHHLWTRKCVFTLPAFELITHA